MNKVTVAVGGVGGSGTRVVAEILSKCGVDMGDVLNAANDNLWFTRLFRRIDWMYEFPDDDSIKSALALLQIVLEKTTQPKLSEQQFALMEKLLSERTPPELAHSDRIKQDFPAAKLPIAEDEWKIIRQSFLSAPLNVKHCPNGVGWKEPNTHIFLPQISEFFPKLKYVHVVRNGYYMARSRNQKQIKNWGKLYGIDIADSKKSVTPKESLDFWIAANERAINYGLSNLSNRFFILSHDDLCQSPDLVIENLLSFLNVTESSTSINELSSLVQRKSTIQPDISLFSEKQKQSVSNIDTVAKSFSVANNH